VPTGVALPDPREQLFAAAERILRRAGPQALTSRALTTEAGCAKGVLHRHFAGFAAGAEVEVVPIPAVLTPPLARGFTPAQEQALLAPYAPTGR
jgi:hypothetical protein